MFRLIIVFFILCTAQAKADANTMDAISKRLRKISGTNVEKSALAKSQFSPLSYNDQIQLCYRDELQISDIEQQLFRPLQESAKNKKWDKFNLHFAKDLNAQKIKFPSLHSSFHEFSGIQVRRWSNSEGASFKNRMEEFSVISDLRFDVIDYTVPMEQRAENFKILNADTLVRFEVQGVGKNKERRIERGTLQAKIVYSKNNWIIERLQPVAGEVLTSSRGPGFREVTSELGFDKLPTYLRTEAIRRGGYALSVTDINNDKIKDIFIAFRDGVGLFAGSEDGSYKDVLKGSGLESLNFVKTAIFADFNNKGTQDLVVTTLVPGSPLKLVGDRSVLFFRGNGQGKFERVPLKFGKKNTFMEPMPAAVADFDADGYLDLYVGYPGMRDFTVFNDDSGAKEFQGLFVNDQKGGFKDFTDRFKPSDYQNSSKLFPHAGLAVNFDQKGGVDLIVADDRNNLSPIYVNQGAANFTEMANQIGAGNWGYGMSAAAGDLDNDGLTDLLWTNVNFISSERSAKACSRSWQLVARFGEPGMKFLKGTPSGKFQEQSEFAGFSYQTGYGAAGVTILDYDNDGLQDIYLVNGLWSGVEKAQDLSAVFVSIMGTMNLDMQHALKAEDHTNFKSVLSTEQGHFDNNGWVHVKGERPSLAGYQRNKLFRNNGDGTFTDVAFLEGVDSLSDGYIVGTQINKNGFADLILRNGDPGSKDIQFPVMQFYRNEMKTTNRSVIITLEGSNRSNRDAIGAFVVANFKKHKQVQHLIANSGSMQSEQALHFGLGNEKVIPQIDIHWPSGQVQKMTNISAGRHHIVETSGMKSAQNN